MTDKKARKIIDIIRTHGILVAQQNELKNQKDRLNKEISKIETELATISNFTTYEELSKFIKEKQSEEKKAENQAGKLVIAAKYGDFKEVRSLIAQGVDANTFWQPLNMSVLHAAIAGAHYQIAYFLVKNGAKVNNDYVEGMTDLHWAIFYGNVSFVQFLIKRGASNYPTSWGQYPVELAKQWKHKELTEFLKNIFGEQCQSFRDRMMLSSPLKMRLKK